MRRALKSAVPSSSTFPCPNKAARLALASATERDRFASQASYSLRRPANQLLPIGPGPAEAGPFLTHDLQPRWIFTVLATLRRLMPANATTSTPIRIRIESVDLLRGVIMILMALDHTRDYFGNTSLNPTDPASTTVALFFTRWVTHFCAPVFFLLTGTGAYLSLRKRSRPELSKFLFTRGLWLIFLELTVFRCLGFQFNFDYHVTLLNVLWALGWAMIVLS